MKDEVVAITTRFVAQRTALFWDKTRQLHRELHKSSGGVEGEVKLEQLYAYHRLLTKQAERHHKRQAKAPTKQKKPGPPHWVSAHYQFLVLFVESVEYLAVLVAVSDDVDLAFPAGDERKVNIIDPEQPWYESAEKLYTKLQRRVDDARRHGVGFATSSDQEASTAGPASGASGDSAEEVESVPRPPAEAQQC